MSDIEKLTEDQRYYLAAFCCTEGPKALRIIDAHEADRAALVARAEAAERTRQDDLDELERLATEAAALRAELTHLRGEHLHPCGAREADMLALRAELAEARASLEGLRRELEDRGGNLTRTTWSRLEQYCDAALSANPVSPHAAAERAVLEAVRRWVDGEVTSVAHIAAAEHALRAVAK